MTFVKESKHAGNNSNIIILGVHEAFEQLFRVKNIHFELPCLVSIQFQTKMGEKERFFLQIFLPVKVFFTGTSGKTIYTGKPGLPEQRFTTLTSGEGKSGYCSRNGQPPLGVAASQP